MKEIVKQIIMRMPFLKRVPFYYSLRSFMIRRQQAPKIDAWEKKGKPIPPPHAIKQRVLRGYARKFGLRILVETGTYKGDMVAAMKADFEKIYSVELSTELYERAMERFKGVKGIELIHGDSGIEIEGIMNKINQPTLFWLDGHYSGGITVRGAKDTPIYEELQHILKISDMGRHVIIIDDARCFGTTLAYPSLEALIEFIREQQSRVDIVVQDDSIRITPN